MTIEERLAALEAEVAALKAQRGRTPPELPAPAAPAPERAAVVAAPPPPTLPPRTAPPAVPTGLKEATVGAYWTTRIGAVLILLAAVFLAAYVSVYSTPAIRVSEVLAAAVAAAAIAYWQQRRGQLRFATALHSLADALLFFTAFAAYAFPAMRILPTPGAGLLAQGAAALMVCIHAMQRRSQSSATFGLSLLGWAGGCALYFEQRPQTLAFAGLIAVIASAWRYRNRWRVPLACAAFSAPMLGIAVHLSAHLSDPLAEAFFTLLPLVLALPLLVATEDLETNDRFYLLWMLAFETVPALVVGPTQVLLDSLSGFVLAAGFALRRRHPAERRVPFQVGCVAALVAELFLADQYHQGHAVPAMLGLTLVAGMLLCAEGDAVHPVWQLAFWGLAAFAEGASLISWAAPTGQTEINTWCAVGAGVVAAFACVRRPKLVWSAVAAAVWLNARIIFDGVSANSVPLALVLTATAVDAVALCFLVRWKGNPDTPFYKGAIVLAMLGALFFGYDCLPWPHAVTFVWMALTAGVFLLGYLRASPPLRIAALVTFAVCVGRLFMTDLNSAFQRIVAFFTLGAILIAIGYLYTRLNAANE